MAVRQFFIRSSLVLPRTPTITGQRCMKKCARVVHSALYKRRLEVGPEPDRHRSVWSNWNYDAEIFACGKRLGEDFNEDTLRQAFVERSYIDNEGKKRAELGFGVDFAPLELFDNEELATRGKEVSSCYIRAFLRHSYPYLPEEGISAIHDYLMTEEKLAFVGRNLGIKDLILCEDFPPLECTLGHTFTALIGAVLQDQGEERAHAFVHDFIIPQLIGKDINEMWTIINPMGLLTDILTSQSQSLPEPRLIRKSASETVMPLYWVGVYCERELIGEAPGETVGIAEEMAARDALKQIFRTTDYREPLSLGEKGDKLGINMNKKNLTLKEYVQKKLESS